jgi:hypothetical protein
MARAMEGAAGLRRGEARFADYLDGIAAVLGHASRAAAARAYCTGLLLPGARKSVEPMAARIEPGRVRARHQSLHHVVAKAEWDDAALLTAVRRQVLPTLERHGPVRYWIIDDTGFPKQGAHSVGVTRQYCGQLGKQDNCQVAVSLSVANDHASLPIAHRLYLPETWARDPERRARAGVPEGIGFETKPEIALAQIRAAQAEGVPPGVVLGDAGCRSRQRSWPRASPHVPGGASPGVRAAGRLSPPASPRFGSGPRTATRSAASPGRRSGCSSSGRRGRRSPPSTGSPTCRHAPRSASWSAPPRRAG